MLEKSASRVRGLILPFDGVWPQLGDEPDVTATASILGKVTAGRGLVARDQSVIRADGHYVRIGNDFHIGSRGTVHIAHDVYPTHIGDRVTAGRNAVIHACDVGPDCVFEDHVVILDGSTVGDRVLIEAGSIVFPRSKLDSGFIYAGMPAKPVRPVASRELSERAASIRSHDENKDAERSPPIEKKAFVADTAQVTLPAEMGANASVFFGCRLIGAKGRIEIGENSNIQDNTVIDAGDGTVVIGANTTFGHNVDAEACRVGDNALIGIGARLAKGTVVDDDTMLAAGSHTLPGQHLEGGWLWAGRPSKPHSRLDDRRRKDMAAIVHHYCNYAAAYRTAQAAGG